jgi:hypothetical protein
METPPQGLRLGIHAMTHRSTYYPIWVFAREGITLIAQSLQITVS